MSATALSERAGLHSEQTELKRRGLRDGGRRKTRQRRGRTGRGAGQERAPAHFSRRGFTRHDDPRDRPPEIFAGLTGLHFGGAARSYLLLPVIPPHKRHRKAAIRR